MTSYIGIDPGVSGGMAAYSKSQGLIVTSLGSLSETDIFEWLNARSPGYCVLEQVHSSPQQGVRSAFTFGQSYGILRMAVVAAGIRLEHVSPPKWKSAMGVKRIGGGFGKRDTAKKRASKRRAQELFPDVRVTHATADALLLMDFCRRKFERRK